MSKNTTECPRPELGPGPLALESSALTMRPPRLPKEGKIKHNKGMVHQNKLMLDENNSLHRKIDYKNLFLFLGITGLRALDEIVTHHMISYCLDVRLEQEALTEKHLPNPEG